MTALHEFGAAPDKLHTLRNGVDLERFQPEDRLHARRKLGLAVEGRMLLSVGHLIERKGHHIAIEALASLPSDVSLLIAGGGPERSALEQQVAALGLTTRVRFVGIVPQAELKSWYSAADALVLCSSREGWANVLLESMACGTPVIASNIWGTPEVVAVAEAGVLMRERNAAGLVEAWKQLDANMPDRAATRAYATGFAWEPTTAGQLRIFGSIVGSNRASAK